eukprot:c12458_g1_i1 orf=238-933(+)
MGACLSCFPHRFLDNEDDYRQASAGGNVSRWRRCCRSFFFFPSCCGMYEALSQTSEEQDAASAHGSALLQSTGSSGEASAPSSAPIPHSSFADTRHVGTLSSLMRHDKMGTNRLQAQIGETRFVNSSGSGRRGQALVIEQAKVNDYNGDQKLKDNMSKLPPSSKIGKLDAVASLLDDEDVCPTCLDGYDPENPKIITKCGHHFHLACILEWMERNSRCPLCDREMIFNESP